MVHHHVHESDPHHPRDQKRDQDSTAKLGHGPCARPDGSGSNRDFPKKRQLVQRASGPDGDSGEGILCQHDREARSLPEQDIHIAELRTAADQDDALVDDVGRQLRRRAFEGNLGCLDHGIDGLGEACR